MAQLDRLALAVALAERNGLLRPSDLLGLQRVSHELRQALSRARPELDLARVWPRSVMGGDLHRDEEDADGAAHPYFWPLSELPVSAASHEPSDLDASSGIAAKLAPVEWTVVNLCANLSDVATWDELVRAALGERSRELRQLWARHVSCPDSTVLSARLTGLRELRVLDAPGLRGNLAGLSGLQLLERLYLGNCDELLSLDGIETLARLTHLELVQLDLLGDLEALGKTTGLRSIKLKALPAVIASDGLQGASACQELAIVNCRNLTELDALQTLKCPLRRLVLGFLPGLTEVPPLSRFLDLREVHFVNLPLMDLHCLHNATSIRILKLEFLRFLHSLSGTKGCWEKVRQLSLRGCVILENLDELEECQYVEWLSLGLCASLRHLPDFVESWPMTFFDGSELRILTGLRPAELAEVANSRAARLHLV